MKYRLKFKALDARIGIRDRIIEYFKANKDYKGDGTESYVESYVDYVDHWGGDGRLYRVYFDLRGMMVSQFNYDSLPTYPIPFTGNDLRLFDELGFELTPRHKDETKQNIDDWFDKKAQDIGLITKERFVEAFKSLGYEEDSADEGFANMEGDHTTWAVSKLIGTQKIIIRYYEGESWEETRGTAGILHKNISGTPQFVKGPDNVLRLLDNLGIELNEYHTRSTGQRVDDWFIKKANDIDIRQTIIDKLTSWGYKSLVEDVDNPDTDTDYTIRMYYPKDDRPEIGEYITVYTTPEKVVAKEFCSFNDAKWSGYLTCEYISFTNEELQFFDNLGFNIESVQKQYIKQNIDDWFWNFSNKANDIDIRQTIIDFYKTNYPKLEVDATHKMTIYIIKKDKLHQVETNVYLDTQTISRFKRRLSDGVIRGYETFEMRELKLFDNLGFDFDTEYKTYTHQRMDDWFREENQNKK